MISQILENSVDIILNYQEISDVSPELPRTFSRTLLWGLRIFETKLKTIRRSRLHTEPQSKDRRHPVRHSG